MSAARKREHASAEEEAHALVTRAERSNDARQHAPPNIPPSRQDVINRLDKLPSQWAETAVTYGVPPQLDAILSASGKHIARTIESVTDAWEAHREVERNRPLAHRDSIVVHLENVCYKEEGA
jgi:hypothetical protein